MYEQVPLDNSNMDKDSKFVSSNLNFYVRNTNYRFARDFNDGSVFCSDGSHVGFDENFWN